MSNTVRSRILVAIAAAAVVAMAMAMAAIGSTAKSRVREISLVARDMAFYADGGSQPNPVLHARPGERLRISLTNNAPGLIHDLSIAAVSSSTSTLTTGQVAAIEFTAPAKTGDYEYRCRPHALMMKGVLRIQPQ